MKCKVIVARIIKKKIVANIIKKMSIQVKEIKISLIYLSLNP